MDKFEVGQRVTRPSDVWDACSPLMHGVVVERYSEPLKKYGGVPLGPYPELYVVRWDSGKVQRGFLPYGLQKASQNP